jgi:hypothetical protein
MFPRIETILTCLQELGSLAVLWFDETSLGGLMLVAFVFHLVSQRLPQRSTGLVPPVSSGMFLLVYFLHRYLLDGDRFDYLLASVFRSLLASHIVWSIANLIALAVQAVSHQVEHSRRSLIGSLLRFLHRIVERWRRLRQWRLQRRPAPPPQEVAPPPRAVLLRQQAEAAQADYEAEVTALVGLPLDEDERDMLLNQAKQRLLRSLKQGE